MKKFLFLLLLALLPLAPTAFAEGNKPPQPRQIITSGSVAPDFTLENMQGEKVRLSQFRGKVVIVNFWATWCPPCRREMPSMQDFYLKFKDDDLVLLAVNIEKEGRSSVAKLLQDSPYSFPILLDNQSRVQNLYGVFRFPESFIIDRNGIVVRKVIGAVSWMGDDFHNMLRIMLKN